MVYWNRQWSSISLVSPFLAIYLFHPYYWRSGSSAHFAELYSTEIFFHPYLMIFKEKYLLLVRFHTRSLVFEINWKYSEKFPRNRSFNLYYSDWLKIFIIFITSLNVCNENFFFSTKLNTLEMNSLWITFLMSD